MSSGTDPATGTQRLAGALAGAALIGMLLACSSGSEGESKPSADGDKVDTSVVSEWTSKVSNLVGGSDESEVPAPDPEEAAVVKCEIKGSVSFMSRGDCLQRRGRPF